MRIRRKTKVDFPKDTNDLTILKTAEDISIWVKLGFQEQKNKYKQSIQDMPLDLTIDLSNCNLSTFCSISKDGIESRIFNLCDLAGIVDGIQNLNDNNEYLFQIEENIDFLNSIIHGAFFHYVVFKRRVRMDNAQIISTTSFFKCIFYDIVTFNEINFTTTTTFTSCRFKNDVYMQKAKINSFSIEFRNIIFEKTFNAHGLVFIPEEISIEGRDDLISFRKCIFKGRTVLSGIKFILSIIFTECTFSGFSTFNGSTFDKPLLFKDCQIANVMLFTTNNNKELDRKTSFEKLTLWSVKITGDVHFESSFIKKFDCCFAVIESGGRLRLFETSINHFTFSENTINGRVDIIECNIDKIDLNATIVTGYLNLLDTELIKQNVSNRNTAQILKNESLKLNNVIQSVQMKQIEMSMYLAESSKKFKWDNTVSFRSYLKNIPLGRVTLLTLNFISNGFGLKWGRGILFTMITAFLFFSLINFFGMKEPIFVIDFKFNNFGEIWKRYLNVLNVLNFKDKLDGFELNACGETLFFISKIFLSYGIYQTISAFRKYGK